MAYDSATDTALAGQAYKRALAIAQQKRDQLNRGYGLNADGSLDNTDAGHLGSIYQTGLAGEQGYEAAAAADRRRGFAGSGGLAGRGRVRARQGAIDSQASALQGAATALGGVGQEEQLAGQDYQANIGTIASKSAYDLAQTLAAQPLAVTQASPFNTPPGSISPAQAAAQRIALAKNPRAAQVAKNNRY